MSGDALLAIWNAAPIDWDVLEPHRLAIKKQRRPSKHVIAIIDQVLALCVIPSRGYADPTYAQILSRCPSIKSTDAVKYALQVLTNSGRWVTVKGPCQGERGMPGRAPQRVFYRHDPKNLLEKIETSECVALEATHHTALDRNMEEAWSVRQALKQQRTIEIELKIAEWRELAASSPALLASLAEKQIVVLKKELEIEAVNV